MSSSNYLSKSSSYGGRCTEEESGELRRGPWTVQEDTLLIHYISSHGDGRWNLLAHRSGLKRTGKSCRLRWLNYLKPDVRRGNLTPQEQLLILELHSKWGNRWSKIAQHLPGRTDNEIKNYWRTRVQKQARHLKIDPNSTQFQELIRCVWMPRLLQKIHGQYSLPVVVAAPAAPPTQQDDIDHIPSFPITSSSTTTDPSSIMSSSSPGSPVNFSDQMNFHQEDMDSYPHHHHHYYNYCNNVDDSTTGFDMVETFSSSSSQFPVMGAGGGTVNKDPSSLLSSSSSSSSCSSTSADHIYSNSEDQNYNHWFAGEEFIDGSLWNMDDLLQFRER